MIPRMRLASLFAAALLSAAFAGGPAMAQPGRRAPPDAVKRDLPQAERIRPNAGTPNPDAIQVTVAQPRFIVEAVDMHADDETGIDVTGSDEIVARFQARDSDTFTGVYGDFDTGETKVFRTGQTCITPAIDPDGTRNYTWECNPAGVAGPITFTVTIFEIDLRGFCNDNGSRRTDVAGESCVESNDGDAIGRYRVSLTEAFLVGAMRRVGDRYSDTISIDECSWVTTTQHTACGSSTASPAYAAYRLRYQIRRVADAIVPTPQAGALN